jgi:hypothetical protein
LLASRLVWLQIVKHEELDEQAEANPHGHRPDRAEPRA